MSTVPQCRLETFQEVSTLALPLPLNALASCRKMKSINKFHPCSESRLGLSMPWEGAKWGDFHNNQQLQH